MDEQQLLTVQFETIKNALSAHGCRMGRKLGKFKQKVRTPGWSYMLVWTNESWELQPYNTSERYQQLFKAMGEAIAIANQGR